LQQLPAAVEVVLRKATDDVFAEEAAADSDFAAALESYRRHQTASPIATHTLSETNNDAIVRPATPATLAAEPPPAEKGTPKRTSRKTRKKEVQEKSWRDEVFRTN
jgi:hypothetical protein